jgi:hypothetical protein
MEFANNARVAHDPRMSRFANNYSADWKEINAATCEAAGHRCIRCGHPYRKGMHGRGEWSPCDEKCSHGGPVHKSGIFRTTDFPVENWTYAQWRILTVHHFDGDKANNAWWNLLALCQRCHLQIQGKIIPENPYFFEHSEWIKPYVAGFYAKKYKGVDLTRIQVMDRLDQFLALELRTA